MKVFFETIGCRLNQSEIEKMASQFRSAGHEIVAAAGEADLVVVNTCTVTGKAAADSRQAIRRAYRSGQPEIVVTGCWSTLQPDDAKNLQGVVYVVPNDDKESFVSKWLDLPANWTPGVLQPPRSPLPGHRKRTRAFIKVQDGCDQFCTYCITRIARGKSKSRSMDEVTEDVIAAQQGDAKEVVLSGVQLGAWGKDFSNPIKLSNLIENILKNSQIPRIRLSSIEPWDIDEDLICLWENSRLCRHLHIPMQSGSDSVLRRMARPYSAQDFASLLEKIRGFCAEISIATDLIVGFPGESDQEFIETCDFVRRMNFSGGHVFSFSARPGTAAAKLKGDIPAQVKKERNAHLQRIFGEASVSYRNNLISTLAEVLWESAEPINTIGYELSGLSDDYIRVRAPFSRNLYNHISTVRLKIISTEGMYGELEE